MSSKNGSASPKDVKKQKSYWSSFMKRVEEGREGRNHWVPVPFQRLAEHLGITHRMYHLIGGDPGSGKSAYTHLNYVLHPYIWWRKNRKNTPLKIKIVLRSMERSRDMILAKWVAWALWQKYGILTDLKRILSWGKDNRLDDDLYEKVMEQRAFFEEMQEDMVTIIDGPENPTGIWKHIRQIANGRGREYKPNPFETVYEPDDPNELVIYILDHIGCLSDERGYSEKAKIDKMSEYLRIARDRYGMMCVVVNQFNRSLSDTGRRTNLGPQPEKQDFKGSGNMYEDADGVLGLFNPHEYGLAKDLGYHVQRMINAAGFNRYRSLYLLKNTYGIDNIAMGLNFIGEIGHYRELPIPKAMTSELYRGYANLKDADSPLD